MSSYYKYARRRGTRRRGIKITETSARADAVSVAAIRKKSSRYRKRRYKMPTVAKLASKKLDSLIEKRISEISKKEIENLRETLIFRAFLYQEYDEDTNLFTTNPNNYELINWDGRRFDITDKIIKADNASVVNVPQADDPSTLINEALDGMGVNVVAPIKTMNGRRVGSHIDVYGIQTEIRAENPADKSVTIFYKIVSVVAGDALTDVLAHPQANKILCKRRHYGYSSKLDLDWKAEISGNPLRVRTIAKGQIRLRAKFDDDERKGFTKSNTRLSRPIHIEYEETDQKGSSASRKIYFVVRSTCPSNAANNANRPKVGVCIKMYYKEP